MIGCLVVVACSTGDGPSDPPPARASLAVTITGLPLDATAGITVSGPGGYSRTLTTTTTLTSLAAGDYVISSADVVHEGSTFAASPTTQSIALGSGAVTTANVSYSIATGTLSIVVSGLPDAVPGSVVILGPDGFNRTVSEPTNLPGLKPGAYVIEGRQVVLPNATYGATPAIQAIDVAANAMPAVAQVAYALASGSMELAVSGLPGGADGAITITGPASFDSVVAGHSTLGYVAPGDYTFPAANVLAGGGWGPSAAPEVVVGAG
jgi:hypothetical protein